MCAIDLEVNAAVSLSCPRSRVFQGLRGKLEVNLFYPGLWKVCGICWGGDEETRMMVVVVVAVAVYVFVFQKRDLFVRRYLLCESQNRVFVETGKRFAVTFCLYGLIFSAACPGNRF